MQSADRTQMALALAIGQQAVGGGHGPASVVATTGSRSGRGPHMWTKKRNPPQPTATALRQSVLALAFAGPRKATDQGPPAASFLPPTFSHLSTRAGPTGPSLLTPTRTRTRPAPIPLRPVRRRRAGRPFTPPRAHAVVPCVTDPSRCLAALASGLAVALRDQAGRQCQRQRQRQSSRSPRCTHR